MPIYMLFLIMHKNLTYFSLMLQMHATRTKVPQYNFFILFRFI